MPKAIIDPAEVRNFQASLRALSEHLRDRQVNITASTARLHEVWQDEKYQRFTEILSQAMRQLDSFLRYSEAYNQYLGKKAELAQRIVERKY